MASSPISISSSSSEFPAQSASGSLRDRGSPDPTDAASTSVVGGAARGRGSSTRGRSTARGRFSGRRSSGGRASSRRRALAASDEEGDDSDTSSMIERTVREDLAESWAIWEADNADEVEADLPGIQRGFENAVREEVEERKAARDARRDLRPTEPASSDKDDEAPFSGGRGSGRGSGGGGRGSGGLSRGRGSNVGRGRGDRGQGRSGGRGRGCGRGSGR